MAITPVDNPSLKWKGPVDSNAQTPPPIEYDVDDPTFCSPESVLSGLASGYCERRAVLNPEFVVSFGATEAQNTVLNWNDATSSTAYRESIVHNLVENIAAHNTALVSAFCPNDATFMVPMVSTAQAPSTYMTHMDGMLDTLITSGAYVTDTTGFTAYTTFDQVAKSAVSAADANQSALAGSAISGGESYSSQFMPSYPAEWAKERKWMLDQLRYIPLPPTSGLTDLRGSNSYCSANETVSYTTIASAAEAVLVSAGSTVNYAEDPKGSGIYEAMSSATVDGYIGRKFGIIFKGVYNGSTLSKWRPAYESWYIKYGRDTLARPTGDITLDPEVNARNAIVMMAPDAPSKYTDYIDWRNAANSSSRGKIVSAGVTSTISTAASGAAMFEVRSGGSLIISSGLSMHTVLVHSGGYLRLDNGSVLDCCHIEEGGVFSGVPNMSRLCMDGLYPGYEYFAFEPLSAGSKYTMVSTYSSYTPDNITSQANTKNWCVVAGGTVHVNPGAFSERYEESTHNIDGNLIVMSGGTVILEGNATSQYNPNYEEWETYVHRIQTSQRIYVMNGGTLIIGPWAALGWSYYYYGTYRYYVNILAYPGSAITIDARYWTDDSLFQGGTLEIDSRSTLSISILDGTPQKTINLTVYFHFRNMTFEAASTFITVKSYSGSTATSLDVSSIHLFPETFLMCFNAMGLKANIATGNTVANTYVTAGRNKISITEGSYCVMAPGVQTGGTYTYNDVVLQEPSKAGIYTGKENTWAIYRCCVESILIEEPGGTTDYYRSFKLRQSET